MKYYCPICKRAMNWVENTLVCPKCDMLAVMDLLWMKKQREKENAGT